MVGFECLNVNECIEGQHMCHKDQAELFEFFFAYYLLVTFSVYFKRRIFINYKISLFIQ